MTIPSSVTAIGKNAFYGCSRLQNFYIEDIEELFVWTETEYGTPLACNGLEKHVFVDGKELTSTKASCEGEKIGKKAFQNLVSLTDVYISNDVKEIEEDAFTGCVRLANFHIDDLEGLCRWGNTTYGSPLKCNELEKHLFIDGEEVTGAIQIPEGVETIYKDAFYECTSITEIEIPSYVTTFKRLAFEGYPNTLKPLSDVPATLEGDDALPLPVTVMVTPEQLEAYCTADVWTAVNARHQIVPMTANNSRTVTVSALPTMSGLHQAIGDQFASEVMKLKVIGSINGYDIMFLNTKMTSLKDLDLSEASIVGNDYEYKVGYHSEDNVITGYAFAEMKNLSNILLPENIISIGDYAFYNDVSLKQIVIPASVTSIGNYAFSGITGMSSFVTLSPKISFGSSAFAQSNIIQMTLNSKVTSIGNYAFKDCKLGSPLTIDGLDCSLGYYSMSSASIDKLTLKGSYSELRRFCLPLNVKEIDISGMTHIGRIETDGVKLALIEVLIFPDLDSTVELKCNAITCENLKVLRLPGGLTSIPKVFMGSSYYESNTDEYHQLYGHCILCPNLQRLIIPNTVTTFGDYAFGSSPAQSIYVSGTYKSISVPAEKMKEVYFEDGCIIDKMKYAFNRCSSLELVSFGNNCSLGTMEGTFYYANGRIIFGDNCTIEKMLGTFSYSSLTSASLGRNCTIKEMTKAFQYCSYLQTFEMNEGTEILNIGDNSFDDCSKLKSINLAQCTNLTNIGTSAFKGCKSLTELIIPSKVATIGGSAFKGCIGLTTMTLSPGVSAIGSETFSGCTALETVFMPSSVRSIGTSAFANCSKLTSFKIPSAMTSIGTDAFAGCTNLTDIYSYTLEPTKITETTFPNMATSTLHVPQQAFYTYYYATPWNKFLTISTFLEPFDYFYVSGDVELNNTTGVIEGEPDAQLNAGGGLILRDQIGQKLGDVHIKNDGTISASLLYDASTEIVEGARLFQEVDVKANQWYFFCFPFDAYRSDVVSPGSYVFRYYDSQERAQNGAGNSWKKLPSIEEDPMLHAGVGYIFQTNTAGTLVVPVEQPDFTNVNRAQDLTIYNSAVTANASWNFTGNVTLGYYEIGDMHYDAPITIWDGKTYVAYRPEDDIYLLSPFQAFFVQRPVDAESLQFDEEAGGTYKQGQELTQAKAAMRRAAAKRLDRLVFDLVLSLDSLSDRTRVVYNDQVTEMYDINTDASKFLSMDASMPQFYSIDGQQQSYAINERPTGNGIVRLGFVAPQAGTYTISAGRMDAFCKLHDNVTGRDIDLDLDDYTFQSEAGTFDNRFEFRCSASVNGVARVYEETGVSLKGGEGELIVKGASDSQPVHIYTVSGEEVAVASVNGAIRLDRGIYVATIGKVSTKVVVK